MALGKPGKFETWCVVATLPPPRPRSTITVLSLACAQ